jgi:hypothetical protein
MERSPEVVVSSLPITDTKILACPAYGHGQATGKSAGNTMKSFYTIKYRTGRQ